MDYEEIIEEIRNMKLELCDDVFYTMKDYYSLSMIIGQIIAYAKCKDSVEINKCIRALEETIFCFENHGVIDDKIIEELKEVISNLEKFLEKKQFNRILDYLLVEKAFLFELQILSDIEKSVIDDILEQISEELEYQLSEKQQQ